MTTLGGVGIVKNCKPLQFENVCLDDCNSSRDNDIQISKSPVIFWFLQTSCFMSFTFPGAALRSSNCFCEFFSFNGYNVMSISCESEQTLDVTEKENSSLEPYFIHFRVLSLIKLLWARKAAEYIKSIGNKNLQKS